MEPNDHPWVTLATIVRTQGRKGELLADLSTDFPESLSSGRKTFLQKDDEPPRPTRILSHWLPTGKSAGRVVLQMEGVDSISSAESFIGFRVVVHEEERLPLEEGAYYVNDLIGCVVMDTECEVGTVHDVHFTEDSRGIRHPEAHPILVLKRTGGDEVMIPLAKEFIVNADLPNKRLVMRLPDGLIDLTG